MRESKWKKSFARSDGNEVLLLTVFLNQMDFFEVVFCVGLLKSSKPIVVIFSFCNGKMFMSMLNSDKTKVRCVLNNYLC